MAKWTVTLDQLSYGGFAPGYWRENYPRFGNVNQSGAMSAMDLTKPGYIQPGPASEVYPGGAANVTTTIRAYELRPTSTTIYAVGGSKFYTLGASATVTHTISATSAAITSHGLANYQGNYYYTWAGADGSANIGKFNGSSTYTDTWWTGTLSATALQTLPLNADEPLRPIIVGNNDVMYFANGSYVGSYDGTTAQDKALDLPTNYEIQDLRWMNDRLFIPTTYKPYKDGRSSIYIWDGTTDSWEAEIPIEGTVGGGYVLNNNYYQFYTDYNGTNKLAVLNGNQLADLVSFGVGSTYTPQFYQITDWQGYIIFNNGDDSNDMYAYGSSEPGEPKRLFHLAKIGTSGTNTFPSLYGTDGAKQILYSIDDQLYNLDAFWGSPSYETTNSRWKSLMFDVTKDNIRGGAIEGVRFNFEKLTSGAVLNWSLVNSQGTTIYSDSISYAKAVASSPQHTLTTAFYPLNGIKTEDFRIELDYSSGSSTAPVRIKNIKLYGEG